MNALMADMPNAARECFEAAKLRGDVEAEAMLGVLTFQGRGEKADPAAGLAKITAAGKAGSFPGQFSLSQIYEAGAGGIPKSP
jgi:TPR repeat protein